MSVLFVSGQGRATGILLVTICAQVGKDQFRPGLRFLLPDTMSLSSSFIALFVLLETWSSTVGGSGMALEGPGWSLSGTPGVSEELIAVPGVSFGHTLPSSLGHECIPSPSHTGTVTASGAIHWG